MKHRTTLVAVAVAAVFTGSEAPASDTVRFATFNASLNRSNSGDLLSDLANPGGAGLGSTTARRILQAANVAEVIQRVNPDVLLVNEFDFDFNGTPTASSTMMPRVYSSSAANLFQTNFLATPQGNGVRGMTSPINFAYRYTPNTNTGLASGFDLNNNGVAAGGDDAFGFGGFPGQFGMTIYSKHEIVNVRTFQTFKWKDMPGNLLTNDPSVGANNLASFYSPAEIDVLRLSSKNHVDVTVRINGQDVHFLTAHPTPPVFDGPEDRNGKRNYDEIRFWKDYMNGAGYIYDDTGATGGLPAGARFVIAGDYNADFFDGDALRPSTGPNAIGQVLLDPLVNTSVTPESAGGVEAATVDGGVNAGHVGDPKFDTADFADSPGSAGNLRVDYVLPSENMQITAAGVFWPEGADPNFPLVGRFSLDSDNPTNLFNGLPTSDHKAVWVDLAAPVPEPSEYALMLAGLGMVGWMVRRRRQTGVTSA